MCTYYESCCVDFYTICPKKSQCRNTLIIRVKFTVWTTSMNIRLPPASRGDTFSEAEEVSEAPTSPPETTAAPAVSTLAATTPTPLLTPTTSVPTFLPADADAAPCSGRPFDAFLQLKNTSIYAFRGESRQCSSEWKELPTQINQNRLLFHQGEYFFELDDKSILPGYPKLIQDVWGIPGPIDAAFTRINCHGKSYIFKVNIL